MIPVGGRTSYLGDVLAVVVATDRQTALAAAALVEVEYDVQRADHRSGRCGTTEQRPTRSGSSTATCCRARCMPRGDVDAALAASAHVLHEVFQTQRIEHAFLEPESTLAVPRRRRHGPRVLGRPGRVGRPRPDRRRCSA